MTDTSRGGDLVKMLADAVFTGTGVMKDGKHVPIEDVYLDPRDARIEALEAENERLRGALIGAESDFHLVALESCITVRVQQDAKRARDNCRAALGEKQ